MNTNEKIIHIMARLKCGEYISSKECATFYEVSHRTAERYFNDKIPLFLGHKLSKDKYRKWFFNHDDEFILTEEEKLSLFIMLEQNKNFKSNSQNEILKLVNKVETSLHTNSIYTKSDFEGISSITFTMIEIEKAIKNKNIIKCEYKNKKRTVAPLKIVNFDGFWYLLIKELESSKFKTFYFKDISIIEIQKEQYKYIGEELKYRLDNAINSFFDITKREYPVQLFVSYQVADYFIRKKLSSSQRIIKEYDDKSIEIELYITNDMEIIPTIQKFIPYIKVLSPVKINNTLKKNLHSYFNELKNIYD